MSVGLGVSTFDRREMEQAMDGMEAAWRKADGTLTERTNEAS